MFSHVFRLGVTVIGFKQNYYYKPLTQKHHNLVFNSCYWGI